MPAWLWWAPLAVLVLALGIWAFRWGWIATMITETDVINTYAERYLQEAGNAARRTDCSAVPGDQNGVWIMIRCAPSAGGRYDYPVDRFGRLLELRSSTRPPTTPEI
ncbi:hypothetical protein [Roseobacter sp.]|uniref:hypothetical protein n=1 Tax=Roseobacter sp. TaxID=1907202 RepID=UPI00385FB1F2